MTFRKRHASCPKWGPVALLAVLVLAPTAGSAQVEGPRVGVLETGLLLRQMDGEKRVLMIGAHPDDEDTSMLAALARGHGVTTAYLSLSRGEGGQNLIGSELGEGLGLLRTGELLAARGIDGAEQFFTRAFDFGFSKSAQETFGHWPEEELVRDVTWVIRVFRPHVILSVFTGTERDGHGQHQAAGIAARRAFEVAGDPRAYPDQLQLGVEAWGPAAMYQLNRFGGSGASPIQVQTGSLDPLLGRSYFQIAMDSRSQHRSQDMGSAQSPGPRVSGVTPVAGAALDGPGVDGIFAGIDTTLAGIAVAAEVPEATRLASLIADYREAVTVATELLHPTRTELAVAALEDAVTLAQEALAIGSQAPDGPGRTELLGVLERREALASQALLAASGIVFDVRVDRDRIVPGDEAEVSLSVWNGSSREVTVREVAMSALEGWGSSEPVALETVLAPGELREWDMAVHVPVTSEPSRPYFLEQPREGSLYQWPIQPESMGRPGNPPLVSGHVRLSVGGAEVAAERAGSHVRVDQADGEFRLPVFVVPPISVSVDPAQAAWPSGTSQARSVSVRVSNLSSAELEGEVRLMPPPGWELTPQAHSVTLGPNGGGASYPFEVRPGDEVGEGIARFRALVRSGGREYEEGVAEVDYRHVNPALQFHPAGFTVSHFPVEVREGVRVGYIMGPGDSGVQALLDLGVQVEELGPEEVRSGDLSRFDTLVLGIRAYETREDLRASNERLLDFVRQGGTAIVQYNQYQYPAGGFSPLPLEIARPHDRVTDPEATVTRLVPDHPLLNSPNVIGTNDFEGWVQERGLYFLSTWDDGYVPLLEMSDPGEEGKRGSLVVTRAGEGAYVYTGLALFRQFPAGVPGAFRLLANLVSLRGSDLGAAPAF